MKTEKGVVSIGSELLLFSAENNYRISRYHEFVGRDRLTGSFSTWVDKEI